MYTFRLDLWMIGDIKEIIETRATLCKTTAEFIRTAIYLLHGVWAKKLEAMDKIGRRMLTNIDKRYLSEQFKLREGRRLEFKATLEKFKDTVFKLKAENDYDELEDEVESMIGNLLGLNDERWGKKY